VGLVTGFVPGGWKCSLCTTWIWFAPWGWNWQRQESSRCILLPTSSGRGSGTLGNAFLCRESNIIIHHLLPTLLLVHKICITLMLRMRKRKKQAQIILSRSCRNSRTPRTISVPQ
jgi:hypothetical protein